MRPAIVVDSTPLISALLGGFSREILFDHHFEFITTEYTLQEVIKYIPYISKKAEIDEPELKSLLGILPVKAYSRPEYQESLVPAKLLIRDQNDVDILALALSRKIPLWSEDKDFEGIKEIKLIKTKDFV